MTSIAIDEYVTPGVVHEVKRALPMVRHGKARLVRIPVMEFSDAIGRVVARHPYMPFRPTLCGMPVDQTIGMRPEIVVVHDDDTNAALNVVREEAVGE